MATEVMKTFSALQQELSKAKEGLRSVDDHIKRLIGRDPEGGGGPPRIGLKRTASQLEDGHGRGRGFPFPAGRGRRDPGGHGRPMDMEEGPPGIRRRLGEKTVFSRLSGPPPRLQQTKDEDSHDEEEPVHKPAISSRVIPQMREQPSKEEVLAAQGDERSKARNRRMFGALLGTLQKFRQEETLMREREDKRAQVEKRLEEAAKREKEEMKRERQELFFDRQRKKAEIRRIEHKIQRIKEQDEWETRHRPLLNFIRTNTKPPIFYLPKIHNVKSEERLVASQKLIATMMEQKRAIVQEELDAMDNRARGRNEMHETHHSEGEEEEMEVEEACETNENSSALEEVTDEHSLQENPDKENRLRSVNVKVEKEPEQKITLAGKIVRPVMDNENHNEGDHLNQRESRDPRDQREQHDRSREKHREERIRERDRDRDRLHDRNRDKDRDRDNERNRERGRERERMRFRERDRRIEREVKREDRKEEEGRWDRKKERDFTNDVGRSQMVVVKEEVIKDKPKWGDEVQELSLISLPGEVSPPHTDGHDI